MSENRSISKLIKAIPDLKTWAELSVTRKTTVLTGGSEGGIGIIMWWQQKHDSTPTAFCCFWHKMKEEREKEQSTASTGGNKANELDTTLKIDPCTTLR